jgi:hypothetical protein
VEAKGGIPSGAILIKSPASFAIRSGERKLLNVRISLPRGYHLTQGANSRFECSVVNGNSSFSGEGQVVVFSPKKGPLQEAGDSTVAATISFSSQGAANGENCAVRVLCTVYFCQDKSVCLFQELVFEVPLLTTTAKAPAALPGNGNGSDNNIKKIDLMYTLSAERTSSSSLPVI